MGSYRLAAPTGSASAVFQAVLLPLDGRPFAFSGDTEG